MTPKTTRTSSSSLWIPPELRARIEHAAQRELPHPSCGVLIGRASSDRVLVKRVVHAENLARQRPSGAYELDPLALFRAERLAGDLGLSVVGIWVSRAADEARPTRIDLALAWEGWSYLFVAARPGKVRELRSWRLVGGDFVEERVVAPRDEDQRPSAGADLSGTSTSIEPFQ